METGYYAQHGTIVYWDGKTSTNQFDGDYSLAQPHGKFLGKSWTCEAVQHEAARITRKQLRDGELS